jgi:hypothetical protein
LFITHHIIDERKCFPCQITYARGLLNECEGWLDNETFVLTRELEIRKSDGVPYKQLSEKEQEILDADSSLMDYKIEKFNAKRPSL